MNANFRNQIDSTGKSLYDIALGSGIPYTTISQLYHGKRDINKVAAETVMRLSAFFNTDAEQILNPINYVENVKGRDGRISYTWHENDGKIVLSLKSKKREQWDIELSDISGSKRTLKYEELLASMKIEEYLEEKRIESELQKVYGELHK